jgi:tartrate-resistant acid phosphatase type 5
MRRILDKVQIKNPSKGLLTYVPPDLSATKAGRYIVEAENVRAEFGQLKAAPGYERVHVKDGNLDRPANLIFQPEIVAVDREMRTAPIIGTDGKLYVVRRRARELVCSDCETTFAVVGDSGRSTPSGGSIAAEDVANLIRSWSPDFVVHTGDLVYPGSGAGDDENPYEALVARFYYPFMGGYRGLYGTGPEKNAFFPALGNHDWTDGPSYRFFEAFTLPPPERYYTIRKGPCQFFFLNSFGYGPESIGPGENPIQGTGAPSGVGEADLSWPNSPQAQWLQAQIALSDSAWRIVVFHHPEATSTDNYWPGYAVMAWPWQTMGVDLVLNGHAHVYERIVQNGVTRVVSGLGGASRYSFVTPPTLSPLTDENGVIITLDSGEPIEIAHGGVGVIVDDEGLPILDSFGGTLESSSSIEDVRPYATGSVSRYADDYGALRVRADRGRLAGEFFTRTGIRVDTFTLTAQRTTTSCYIGDAGKTVLSLEVLPAAGTSEVGGVFQFLAVAYFTDGTSQDVTDICAWVSDSPDVATVSKGRTFGIKPGTAVMTATYGGKSDTGTLNVLVACVDDPIDLVLVVDESYSMWQASGTSTRIDRFRQAAHLMIDAATEEDSLGVIAFNGDYFAQKANTRIIVPLGGNKTEAHDAVDALVPAGATATHDAVETAIGELTGPRHVEGRRRVLVLFTDGIANVVDGSTVPPPPSVFDTALSETSTQAMIARDLGITVAVVSLGIRHDTAREPIVASWASDGFYFAADVADELPPIFANLLGDLCRDGDYYRRETPLSVGTDMLFV